MRNLTRLEDHPERRRQDPSMLGATLAAIDAENCDDPNDHHGEPLALVQGRTASRWLDSLCTNASDELRLAVRAHHLRRWEIPRSTYAAGRAGYLRWRRDNKAHQAESLAAVMRTSGWPHDSIETARAAA